MSRALRQIVMMRATIMTNTFLYYLKRLWLIGKLVPDRVYGNPDFKIVLAVLFTIVGQVVSLTCKVLYVLVMVVLPTWMMKRVHVDAFDYMVQYFIFPVVFDGTAPGQCRVPGDKREVYLYPLHEDGRSESSQSGFMLPVHTVCVLFSHCGSGRRLVPGRECVERHLSVACDCDVPGSGRGVPGMVF